MTIDHNTRRIHSVAIVVDYWIEKPMVPEYPSEDNLLT